MSDEMSEIELQRRMDMAGARILIVDDHEMVRFGVRNALLSSWTTPRGDAPKFFEAGTVADAISELEAGEIDIAILDLRLTDGSGLEVASYIMEKDLDTQCVVLTSVKSARAVVACYETGAVAAILEKSDGLASLITAVENASKGLQMLTARDAERARQAMLDEGVLDRSKLSEKENHMADLVASGLNDGEIAEQMFIAPTTVRNVLSKIYKKLDIEGRNRLTQMVWQERPEEEALG